METHVRAIVVPPETAEFADDVRRLFTELYKTGGPRLTGECSPPLDVYETETSVEIALDLPGVDPAGVRAIAKGNAVLIVGEKSPRRARGDASFHLVERGYGRFARVVRLSAACDTGRATATIERG